MRTDCGSSRRIGIVGAAFAAVVLMLVTGALEAEAPKSPGPNAHPDRIVAFLRAVRSAPLPDYLDDVKQIMSGTNDAAVLVEAMRALPALFMAGAEPEEIAGAVGAKLTSAFTDARVRRAGVVALSTVKSPASFELLLEMVYSERDEEVLKRTYWALSRLSGQNFPANPDAWKRWWDGQMMLVGEVAGLLLAGKTDDVIVGLAAFPKVALPGRRLVELVAEHLYHPHPRVREAACQALGGSEVIKWKSVRRSLTDAARSETQANVNEALAAVLKSSGGDAQ